MQAHPDSLSIPAGPDTASDPSPNWAGKVSVGVKETTEGGINVSANKCASNHMGARSSDRFDALVCYGTLIYLLTGTMEGAFRYVLIMVHLETALYLRDLFALMVVGWRLHAEINAPRSGRPLLGLITILGIWTVVGTIYCGSVPQVLFGFKIFLPLMLGIAAYPSVLGGKWRTGPFILLMWLLATAGLYASVVVRMPWTGLSYQIGDIQVEGSREWTIEGVDRLAGFSRKRLRGVGNAHH